MSKALRDIGERIREVRKRAALSQSGLGGVIGKSVSMVSAYEKGDSTPGPEEYAKIAQLGGVTLDWLITGREPAPQVCVNETPGAYGGQDLSAEDRRFLTMLHRLEGNKKQEVLNYLTDAYIDTMEGREDAAPNDARAAANH